MSPLHLVTAVVATDLLDELVEELARAEVHGLTVTEVQVFHPGSGREGRYRGSSYRVEGDPAVTVEVAVDTFDAERIALLIAATVLTTDSATPIGQVRVVPIDRAIRVRTGAVDRDVP